MKSGLTIFFKYIHSFYTASFRSLYFLLVSAMLAVILLFNYAPPFSLSFLFAHSWLGNFFQSYCLYLVPFAAAYLLQSFFYSDTAFLKNKYFLSLLFLAPALFAFRVNFNFHHALVHILWHGDEYLFWLRCTDWIIKAVLLITLVYFAWRIAERDRQPLYGITPLKNSKPYFLLLLLMLPLIILAATQHDFLRVYPRAQIIAPLQIANKGIYYFIFECCYALDFLSIEFFFRGFLILAFLRICGTQCIVPAACFYCCIHLNKPLAEAISSFAGGILLGIVSYHTKSIRGGLIVHIGIAAMMEIAGFIAHAVIM